MAGMAIVLLCALGVNEDGWQSAAARSNDVGTTGAGTAVNSSTVYGAAANTQPELRTASNPSAWLNHAGAEVQTHLDRAGQVTQEQIETAVQQYVVGTPPPGSTSVPPGTPGVAQQTAPGSNWGSSAAYGNGWYTLENALQNPPPGPSTSQAQMPGGRMRTSAVAAPPPTPPLAGSTTAATGFGATPQPTAAAPAASAPGAGLGNWMQQQPTNTMNTAAAAVPQANPAATSSALAQPTVAQSIFGASSQQGAQPAARSQPAQSQGFPAAASNNTSQFNASAGASPGGFNAQPTQQTVPTWRQTRAAAAQQQQSPRQAIPQQQQPPANSFPTARVAETQADILFEGPINSPAPRANVAGQSNTVTAETGSRQYVPPLDREPRSRAAAAEHVVPVRRDVGRAITTQESVELPPTSANTPAASRAAAPAAATGSQALPEARERPWWPLFMAVVGLFGSIGFNLYLGWIAWDLYSRYQEAVDDVRDLEEQLETKQQEAAMAASPQRRKYAAV